MALDGIDTVLFQLKDKPTQQDIDNDQQDKERQAGDYSPMTTRREIVSWWLFDWANSGTWGVGLAFIFPVFLAETATRYACNHNAPYGCDYSNHAIHSDYTLRVPMAGMMIKPESFASLLISLSSFFQAIAYVLFSGLADYGSYKIYLFRITTMVAQIMNMSWLFFVHPDIYLTAGWIGALAFVPFGLCLIFYNAYLGELVENHWRVKRLDRTNSTSTSPSSDTANDTPLKESIEMATASASALSVASNTADNESQRVDIDMAKESDDAGLYVRNRRKLIAAIKNELSQWGFAIGFCGANMVTIMVTLIVVFAADSRVEFVEDIGLNDGNGMTAYIDNYTYSVNEIASHEEEFYVHPVVDVNVKYSVLKIHEDIGNVTYLLDTLSWIDSIQLVYDINDEKIIGSLYGDNSTDHEGVFSVAHNGRDMVIEIESFTEILGENIDSIDTVNVFTANGLMTAVSFSNEYTLGVMRHNDSISHVVASTHTDFVFGGYQVSTGTLRIDWASSMIPNNVSVVTGFQSIAFVSEQGQYGSTLGLRLSYFIAAVWCVMFAIPAFVYLQSRKGPPIPSDSSVWTISVKSYWKTLKRATRYPDLFRLLIAWFMFSDAMNTTAAAGILFGIVELGMTEFELVLLLLEVELTSVMGAFFFVWLQKKLEWNAVQMLLMHLIILALTPLYASIGIIESSPIGLRNIWEMYLFVFVFGFNQGSILALTRSLYSQFTPYTLQAQFFGLFEITNKGSSWIGPMMMAIVSNFSTMRWGLFYIVVFYCIAIPIVYYGIDYDRARKTAESAAAETR